MNHLSFYWLPENNELLIRGIESEFSSLIELAINSGKVTLPPIPDVVLKIQKLCTHDATTILDVADSLLEDPGLAAVVIRVANSVIFNRRNITCTDLVTAVSRLGILRVRDIVTAQAIEQLKHSVNLSRGCNDILINSAHDSRELAATMVMVVKGFKESNDPRYNNLETDKALLTGLLADIGLFCIVNEYHLYLEQGNYLAEDIAFQIFSNQCTNASKLVLEKWGFDADFLEVASNQPVQPSTVDVSYIDVARIANHILMFRRQDDAIDDHTVEFDVTGADILYKLSNLSDIDFNLQINELISASGL
ncbi:HDOD domain-containing protein [Vibrio ostreicida]|uniref:HDOD domain-containing protein n=1 Tax=Vibrio ostreicida TaxID=526588 RepID=A0ABT8BU75_9VIBR|nr:HDOD domain-containing protein [Vibrio ostreicida]MDN3610317.1 HDOD domain-containing protein [Vibrio ostreicida]NPD07669.1 HDOD domain-containing protein [Vibrio ostreicida]